MAVNLGKRAAVVGVIVFLVTAILGLGLTKLEFATGQDSYLNTDEDVYKDNVDYQDLFGGQAMLTLFTMEEGKTIVDLFTPEHMAAWEAIEEEVLVDTGVQSVAPPRAALEFTQRLVTMTPDGAPTDDPTASVPGQALHAPPHP